TIVFVRLSVPAFSRPPFLLNATVELKKLAEPSSTMPKSAPSESVESRTTAVPREPTTTPAPLLPEIRDFSTLRDPESKIAGTPKPPPNAIERLVKVTETPGLMTKSSEGNGSTPVPTIFAPGALVGPSTVCRPVVFVNVTVESGT